MTDAESHITIEYLRECFSHVDGVLYWNTRPLTHFKNEGASTRANQRFAGRVAGYVKKGYCIVNVTVGGRRLELSAHRVVWALHTGRWPAQVIDHINRDSLDNRPSNLRDISPDANLRNNGNPRGTGLLGAYRLPSGHIFSMLQHPYRFLGMFATPEEANRAYLAAAAERQRGGEA